MSLNYGVGAQVAVLVMMAACSVLRAFALAALWRWFASPLGLPVIGWAHAYGIGALVGLAAVSAPPIKDNDIAEAAGHHRRDATGGEKTLYLVAVGVRGALPSLLILALGYVAHALMVAP